MTVRSIRVGYPGGAATAADLVAGASTSLSFWPSRASGAGVVPIAIRCTLADGTEAEETVRLSGLLYWPDETILLARPSNGRNAILHVISDSNSPGSAYDRLLRRLRLR